VHGWSAAEVAAWLVRAGFGQHAAAFEANHVDGSALALLSREDLDSLGVSSVGHRLQILRGVAELCSLAPDAIAKHGTLPPAGGGAESAPAASPCYDSPELRPHSATCSGAGAQSRRSLF